MTRALIAATAAVLIGAHVTGNMKPLMEMFDIGLEPQHLLYLAALPLACVAALVLLKE